MLAAPDLKELIVAAPEPAMLSEPVAAAAAAGLFVMAVVEHAAAAVAGLARFLA